MVVNEWKPEHLERPPTMEEKAAALGLVYEEVPSFISSRWLADTLKISPESVYTSIRKKRLPAEDAYIAGNKQAAWRIKRDDAVNWAYYRRRGPSPSGGVPHLKKGPGLWMGATKYEPPRVQKRRGRPRKTVKET